MVGHVLMATVEQQSTNVMWPVEVAPLWVFHDWKLPWLREGFLCILPLNRISRTFRGLRHGNPMIQGKDLPAEKHLHLAWNICPRQSTHVWFQTVSDSPLPRLPVGRWFWCLGMLHGYTLYILYWAEECIWLGNSLAHGASVLLFPQMVWHHFADFPSTKDMTFIHYGWQSTAICGSVEIYGLL